MIAKLDREKLHEEMLENHRQYNECYDRRMSNSISVEEFTGTERRLNRRGTELRELLGVGAKSVSGAYCHQCYRFYKVGNRTRSGLMSCREHKGCKRCFDVETVMREDS